MNYCYNVFSPPKSHEVGAQVVFDSEVMNCDFNSKKPTRSTVGSIPLPSNFGIGFTNGINNSPSDAKESAQWVSQLTGGYAVDLVYNPTNGILLDSERYLKSSRDLYASNVVPALHSSWTDFFDKSSPSSVYLQVCHSEGVCNVRNALMSFPSELSKRIEVIGVAPSVYINREICKKPMHLVSEFDLVPLLDTIGRERNFDTTVVIKRHKDARGTDHSLISPTYKDILKRSLNKYINSGSN
jgi:hypothetical protein